jgi:hypothetical protein
MKISKKLLGKPIMVMFYDHCMGQQKPLPAIATGILYKHAPRYIVLCHWFMGSGDDMNNEYMTILSSTIKYIKVIDTAYPKR